MIINRLLLIFLILFNVSFGSLEENDFRSYSYYYEKELLESSCFPVLLDALNIECTDGLDNFVKGLKKSELCHFIAVSWEQYGHRRKLIQSVRLYAELRMLGYEKEELCSALREPREWHEELSIFEKGVIFPEDLGRNPEIKKRIAEIKNCFPFIPAKRLSFNLRAISQGNEVASYNFFELRLPYENVRQENYHLFLYSIKNTQVISLGDFYYGIAILESDGRRSIIVDHSAGEGKKIDQKTKNLILSNRIDRHLNDVNKSGFYEYERNYENSSEK